MRNILKFMMIALMSVIILAACGGDDETNNEETSNETVSADETLKVITSFTMLEDIVKQIAGDRDMEIQNLAPIGTDPHEYEPLPEDIKAATDADVLIYNGQNLEGGDHGWFQKMVDSVNQGEDHVFQAAAGVEPMYLMSEDGDVEEINPHVFVDPNNGMIMAKNIRDALIAVDPENEEMYKENAEAYLKRLKKIDEDYAERFNEIPEEDRVLVTSERAYQYLADRYDLKEGYIWEVDTEENGSPEQIKSLVEFVKKNNPPVLFVESNVDKRPMETVSNETGVDIFEDYIYSDEIGAPGEPGDTYVKFLNYNIDVIYEGLSQ